MLYLMKGDNLTYIFDDKTKTFLAFSYFEKIPTRIRNGYTYFLNREYKNEFPNVEIQRLDPSLYTKFK